jgi:hypothetical protein
MRTNENFPGFRFGAANAHDGRERIRLREIHQMNCFDSDVCLTRMLV